jgi:hypothetical protein
VANRGSKWVIGQSRDVPQTRFEDGWWDGPLKEGKPDGVGTFYRQHCRQKAEFVDGVFKAYGVLIDCWRKQ